MLPDDFKHSVESLLKLVISLDIADLVALSDAHTAFQEVQQSAIEYTFPGAAQIADTAIQEIESIILDDCGDVSATLNMVKRAATKLDAIVSSGDDSSELDDVSPDSSQKGSTDNIPELPDYVDDAMFSEFLSRQPALLEEFEIYVLSAEKDQDGDVEAPLKRHVHTLKGEAGLLGLVDVESLCHRLEDLMQAHPLCDLTEPFLSSKDWLARTFSCYSGEGSPPQPLEQLLASFDELVPTSSDTADEKTSEAIAEAESPKGPTKLEDQMGLIEEFVTESREHLDNADVHLLALETETENEDALNAVFRAFHTIKGLAGFFNLSDILDLAHEAENLLDTVRKGELALTGTAMDVTFEAVDKLKFLIGNVEEAIHSDYLLESDPTLSEILTRVKAVLSNADEEEPEHISDASPSETKMLGEILIDSGLSTKQAIDEALASQELPEDDKKLGEVLVERSLISRVQLDEALKSQRSNPEQGKLGEILVRIGAVTDDDIKLALAKQAEPAESPKLGEVLVKAGEVSAGDIAQVIREQKKGKPGGSSKKARIREPVKVDADRLDKLVDVVGELVIAKSIVLEALEHESATIEEVSRHMAHLDKVSRELQEIGMSLRMVPIAPSFQKMARLVRDLAKKSGKSVEFSMSGENTELDKTIVDNIGDPLVHMVRNAVDHGLEATNEERVAAGKPPVGKVELRAFHRGGSIYIEIEDDGRGLDREKILAKARERGMKLDWDNISDRDVWNLIFDAGFSTAKEVTDVSGRGVGMDVVRRNIEALRGKVEISSRAGEGSVFTIRLPLTLAIIDGMVIRVGGERFVIPTLAILITVRPKPEALSTVLNHGLLLSHQGELIPVYLLGEMLGIEGAAKDPIEAVIMIVEDEGRKIGLLIDEVLGQRQIVLKSLGSQIGNLPGISGGAIMPDGNVGLVLDVNGLILMGGDDRLPMAC